MRPPTRFDRAWRIAARFDAFAAPIPVTVPDVRGGVQYFTAAGRLVFRVKDQEWRLTALTVPDEDEFFVMFKDETRPRRSSNSVQAVLRMNNEKLM